MLKKTVLLFLTGLIVILGLSGCGKQASSEKVLKVGTDATYAPFGFQDEKTKEYVGFDIDLIKAIAKQAGFSVTINNLNFDGLIPALQSGNIDIAISDMTITDERAQKVSFSKSYYKAGLGIVVKKDNSTIQSFKDLEGKRIAVSIGSTGAEEAHKIKDANIREFNTIAEAFLELRAGGVDAVINDAPVNEYYTSHEGSKDTKTVGTQLNAEDLGIAAAKNNTELIAKLNTALDDLKKNGEYDKIYVKWFGKQPTK
ncbi:MAG: basic amino acid ABC transporter substrate-binding protein [Sporomusaceae bacterium]|nr:basic amino acid ABC transporter substrate-binding protein [Sporomusaceae bacterium]